MAVISGCKNVVKIWEEGLDAALHKMGGTCPSSPPTLCNRYNDENFLDQNQDGNNCFDNTTFPRRKVTTVLAK